MKWYAVIIEPESGFGTPLKGDTLFGHFCWEVAWDKTLVEGGLDAQLSVYHKAPFVIFSSAFPRLKGDKQKVICAIKKPALAGPLPTFTDPDKRIENYRKKKEEKKNQWVVCEYGSEPLEPTTLESINEQELISLCAGDSWVDHSASSEQHDLYLNVTYAHNTINRLTWSTGDPPFAPYNLPVGYYAPEIELVVFVLLNESATDIENVTRGLQRIGEFGFGRDASTGMGRFRVKEAKELPIPEIDKGNAYYTLAPCVPEQGSFSISFFSPFIRFGRHGGHLARSRNPFKNPVVMADEGAVFFPAEGTKDTMPYIGRPVRGVSKAEPASVVQGYAPILPLLVRS